jgi:hypothetical protein
LNAILETDAALRCLKYEQKSSQGLLSGFESSSRDNLGKLPWVLSSESDSILNHLVASKAGLEERELSDTMLGAYGCLEMIVNSERMQIEDILGAEDILIRNQKEEIFRNVNEKYSILTFFDSIHQRSTNNKETNLITECKHFIRVLNEHPISSDKFKSSSFYSSHDVLARLLALRQLERALLTKQCTVGARDNRILCNTYMLLLSTCHSREPKKSRIISSQCLGELKLAHLSTLNQEITSSNMVEETSINPNLIIKKTILTSLGQFLLSDCMKTAKALLVTPIGKECWQSLDGGVKATLSPFIAHDDGKVQKEAVRVSDSCMKWLRSFTGCHDGDALCWHEKLWTLDCEEGSCELWIRKITCSIIRCCFGKGYKIIKGNQDFFRICQGLCAKEESFAASIFPALIFHLLDSEERVACGAECGVRDLILSNIAIGSPTSCMNGIILHCFGRILSPKSKHHIASQAITMVLNTVKLLRVITESRFLTSSEEVILNRQWSINSSASASSMNDSKKSSATAFIDAFDDSTNSSASASMNAFKDSGQWKGFPYGVVVRVSGLDLALACSIKKKYYSALYYAEMSMNNLICSGNFFENVATNDSPIQRTAAVCDDISGFGILTQMDTDKIGKTVLEKALIAKDIIGRSLSELNAKDELQGVLSQGSALNLKPKLTSLLALDGYHRDRPIFTISDLDNELQTGIAYTHAGSSQGVSAVTRCLEELGLHHIKQNYLVGVESNMCRNDNERRFLREKWFEDALYKKNQWVNSLLPRIDGNWSLMTSGTHHHTA